MGHLNETAYRQLQTDVDAGKPNCRPRAAGIAAQELRHIYAARD